MPYRLVLFDFDGTLADTLAQSLAVFRALAPRFRLSVPDDTEAARSVPTRQLFKQMGLSLWKLPRVVRAFHAETANRADPIKLFPDVPTMLAGLAMTGSRLGILSSNREDVIRTSLKANDVEQRFEFVVGCPKLFGKAQAMRRILRAEKLAPSDVLYVGDETRDVEAARRVGVTVAAVTWGFHTEALLRTANPSLTVTTPAELLAACRG